MTATEPPFVRQWRADAAAFGNEFRAILKSGKSTTIGERVARAGRISDAVERYSHCVRDYVVAGQPLQYDFPNDLNGQWTGNLQGHFSGVHPTGTVDGRFPDVFATRAAVAELKRIVAEAGVTFQVLETFPQLALQGGSIREGTVMIAAKTGKWGALTAAIADVVRRTISEDRLTHWIDLTTPMDPEAFAQHRSCARDAVEFFKRLTLANERDKAFHASFIDKYHEALALDIKARSQGWSVKQLLDLGSAVYRDELQRFREYFPEQSANAIARVRTTLDNALMVQNADRLAMDKEYGAVATLTYPLVRAAEFRNLVLLLAFDNSAMKQIQNAVSASVKASFQQVIVRSGSNPISALPTLMKMVGEFEAAVHVKELRDDQNLSLLVAIQQGAAFALPDDGSVEEAFVSLVDAIIKEKKPSDGPDTRGRRLMELMAGFNLLRDADLFITHYQRHLAARLLLRTKPSFTLERTTADVIARHMGDAAVKPITTMLNEAQARKEGNAPWVNGLVWPSASDAMLSVPLPPAIDAAFDVELHQARLSRGHLQLSVDPCLSTVEMEYRLPGAPHHALLSCSAVQAATLTAIASAGPLESGVLVAELATSLNLADSECRFVLSSLTSSGLIAFAGEDRVHINANFLMNATANKKVMLPSLLHVKRAGGAANAAQDGDEDEEDRRRNPAVRVPGDQRSLRRGLAALFES